MRRIAVGGFQAGTYTVASTRAGVTDFELHDAWSGLTRGPDLFQAVAEFIDAARAEKLPGQLN